MVAGAVLWTYAGFKIRELEQTLKDGNLSLEEKWRSEGSLQWWSDTSRTILYPVAFFLFVVGLAALSLTLFALQILS